MLCFAMDLSVFFTLLKINTEKKSGAKMAPPLGPFHGTLLSSTCGTIALAKDL